MGVIVNPIPKNKPLRNKKYLGWLRNQPCAFTGQYIEYGIVYHHVKLLGGGGWAIKPPDNDCLPILHSIHQRLDSPGHSEWEVFRERWPELKER